MIKEEWRDIEGYEGLYQVSNYGRVKSIEREIDFLVKGKYKGKRKFNSVVLSTWINNSGYVIVSISKKNNPDKRTVHSLVANAFIPNPDNKPCVGHKDCDPLNNCVWNLYWCTFEENMNHPITRQRMKKSAKDRDVSHLFTEECLEKRRKKMIGHNVSEETKKRIADKKSKPLVQLSLDYELIETFENSLIASEKAKMSQGMINRACNGKYYSKTRNKWYDTKHIYKDFIWMFKSDYEKMLEKELES